MNLQEMEPKSLKNTNQHMANIMKNMMIQSLVQILVHLRLRNLQLQPKIILFQLQHKCLMTKNTMENLFQNKE